MRRSPLAHLSDELFQDATTGTDVSIAKDADQVGVNDGRVVGVLKREHLAHDRVLVTFRLTTRRR